MKFLKKTVSEPISKSCFGRDGISLKEDYQAFGCLRRGQNITVLFKQRSKEIEGEFLGRLVLGVEGDDVKVFGATIY